MWDLIVWTKENAIDFVPSIWANSDGTSYKYPLGMSDNSKRRLIYSCKDVKNFVWCEAVVKKSNIASLEKAKELCRQGQETSTFETSSDTDSDGEVEQNKEKTRKRKMPKRFIENDSPEDFSQSKKAKNSESRTCSRSPTLQKKTFRVPNADKTPPRSPASATTVTVETDGNSSSSSSLLQRNDSNSAPQCLFYVKEIYNKLNAVENILLSHISQCSPASVDSNQPPVVGLNFNLPISTSDDLNTLNDTLQEQHKKNELVQLLFLLGGDDPHKAIFTMMNKLIAKDLATQYSGIGKKKKLPFFSLHFLCETITAALRKRFPNVLDSEIKKSVAIYLASAKSRLPKENAPST